MRKKRENVQNPASYEQMREVQAMVIKAIPQLSTTQATHFIGRQREVAKEIRAIFAGADPYREQIRAWEKFYAEHFAITVDLSGLQVPDPQPGFSRLIVVVPGPTVENVLQACKLRFPVWRYTDDNLDKLTESVRTALTKPYPVWVRDRVEADEEHANKSYNDLQKAGILGITLLERLLLELMYFSETGQHLDLQNVTLCSGSLDQYWHGRRVPHVDWYDGKLYVYWSYRDYAYGDLRSRQVVQ